MTDPPDLDRLLAHDGYVRNLARRLVFDADAAEDLAQETWLAALANGPRDLRSPRGWLAALARNALRDRGRTDAARGARERAAARGEEVPSADALLRMEKERRRVVAAVLALEEPYRAAVLGAYFPERPPREVARRLGVPVETVRTRLKRARTMLRARLEGEASGPRGAYAFALVRALRLEPPGSAAAALAAWVPAARVLLGLSAARKVAWAACLAVLAAVPFALRGHLQRAGTARTSAASPQRIARGGAVGEIEAKAAAALAAVGEEPDRQLLAAPPAPEPAGSDGATFHGRVVDVDGKAVAGVTVVLETEEAPPGVAPPRAVSDAAGAFELPAVRGAAGAGMLVARGGGWASVLQTPLAWIPPPEPVEVVVARERHFGGRVVDRVGTPVPHAPLYLRLPDTRASLPGFGAPPWTVVTGADGAFRFPPLGFVPGSTVAAGSRLPHGSTASGRGRARPRRDAGAQRPPSLDRWRRRRSDRCAGGGRGRGDRVG